MPPSLPEDEISQVAYRKWVARGRPSGTHLPDWLEAEAEVRRVGELARQLAEVEEQLTRQIAEGKEADVRRIGELACRLADVEERLTSQIAKSKKAERRLAAEHAVSRILAVSN